MDNLDIKQEFQVKRTYSRYISIDENIHESLDLYSLSLYMAFRFEADFEKQDALVRRSSDFLMKKAKISRRQFFLSLNILEDFGLVQRDLKNTLNSISTYHVARSLHYFNTTCYPVHDMHYPVHHMHTDQDYLQDNNNNLSVIIKDEPKKNTKLSVEKIIEDNPHEIPPDLIQEWKTNRKKYPITKTVWSRLNKNLTELRERGINPHDAFERMVANGWRSLEVSYFEKEIKALGGGAKKNQWDMDSVFNA